VSTGHTILISGNAAVSALSFRQSHFDNCQTMKWVLSYFAISRTENRRIGLKLSGTALVVCLITGCSASGPYFNDTRYARQSAPLEKARIIFFRDADANYRSVTLE
jgi:hypothetical protein